MNSLVTIAIALYNNEHQIERCIQSVLNQTYKNIEILVVNDGSTDMSREKAISFIDERIVIVDKENGGLSSARQMALNKAKGEFISFIDGDDYLKPEYIEKMLDRIQKDNSDICICSTLFEDECGQIISFDTNYFKAKDFDTPIKVGENDQVRWLFLSDSWNKMYRLTFLKSSKVTFEIPKGLNGTDRAFNMKLFVHKPMYSSISDLCYVHVIYKKSAVHRKNKDLLKSYMTIIEQIENECKKTDKLPEFCDFLNKQYYLFLRSSFQDIYNEATGIISIKNKFKSVYKRHQDFVKSHAYLRQPLMNGTKAHIIFLRLFIHFKAILPFYFWSRRAMINIHS